MYINIIFEHLTITIGNRINILR